MVEKLSLPSKSNAVQNKINEIIDNMASTITIDQTYDGTSANPQSGVAIAGELAKYPQKAVDTDITGVYNFKGQKKIKFTQSSSSDKLGFTLYNNNNVEKGYLEYNPSNTVDSVPLMTLGNYTSSSTGLTHVGFRKYSSISGASGAYNLLAPLISDAKTPFNLTTTYTNFYLPLGFTDGVTTVKTAKTGVVDLSSILPDISTKQDTLVSGTNIKTINNTSILGSGDIDTSEIFVAEYNVSTYADVLSAYNNGKTIILKVNDEFGTLWRYSSDFQFVKFGVSSNREIVFCSLNLQGWSTPTIKTIVNDNLSNVSSISSSSAVYTALSEKADTTLSNVSSIDAGSVVADTDLSNLSSTGQGIIDAKVNTSDYYFAINDTISMTYVGGGFLTTSGKSVLFSVPLPKSLANITTITCTAMTANFRKHSGGYLPSIDWNAKANGTITISKQDDFSIYFEVQYNSYGGTNNTPVGVQADISLKFT